MEPMDALFTRVDYLELPEDFPAQLVEGALVKEPGRSVGHQRIVGELGIRLDGVTEPRCSVVGPLDVHVDELNVFWADVLAFAEPQSMGAERVDTPILVIEVLDPRTEALDRGTKALRYLAAGVREVWLVDPKTQTLEIRTTRGAQLVRGSRPAVSQAVPGFEVVPEQLFSA